MTGISISQALRASFLQENIHLYRQKGADVPRKAEDQQLKANLAGIGGIAGIGEEIESLACY